MLALHGGGGEPRFGSSLARRPCNAVEAVGGVGVGARELLLSTGRTETGGVLVTGRDSGPGLAPATLERLFEAF